MPAIDTATVRLPHPRRRRSAGAIAALAATALLGAASTAAHAQTSYGSGPGGPLVDATFDTTSGITPGVFISDIILDQPGLDITQFLSVTLTGLNHTSLGDLEIQLTRLASGGFVEEFVLLTFPPADRKSNYLGTYTFVVNPSLETVDQASEGLDDEENLPAGAFAISGDGGGIENGDRTNFNGFVGLPVSGTWRLTITDNAPEDTGSLGSWSFSANTAAAAVVPEPGTLALAPLGGVFALFATSGRRRRRHRACTN